MAMTSLLAGRAARVPRVKEFVTACVKGFCGNESKRGNGVTAMLIRKCPVDLLKQLLPEALANFPGPGKRGFCCSQIRCLSSHRFK